jgi:hypothetical protein
VQRSQCDGNDQQRDGEIDHPLASVGVRLQHRTNLASLVEQPLPGVGGQRGEHKVHRSEGEH